MWLRHASEVDLHLDRAHYLTLEHLATLAHLGRKDGGIERERSSIQKYTGTAGVAY